MIANDTVTLRPNGGWDPRILRLCACGTAGRQLYRADRSLRRDRRYADQQRHRRRAGIEIARAQNCRQLLAVNTHADWDHAWGNQVFAGLGAPQQVPILASRRCAARLRGRRPAMSW